MEPAKYANPTKFTSLKISLESHRETQASPDQTTECQRNRTFTNNSPPDSAAEIVRDISVYPSILQGKQAHNRSLPIPSKRK